MALANIDARRLNINAAAPITTTSGALNIAVASSLEVASNQIGLSATGKAAALASKYAVVPVRGAVQVNPSAVTAVYNPGAGSYATSGNTTKAILALVKGATASSEFNTSTGKIGASATPPELHYKCKIVDANGEPFYDASNNQVWGVLTSDGNVYFFTGPFDSTATAFSMVAGFRVIYPQRYDLSDFPEASFMSFVFENADAATLGADSVNGTHLNYANFLNGTGGLEEQVGSTLGIKKPANAGLVSDANGLALNPDGSTVELDGTNALRIKALGVGSAQLAAGAVTAAKMGLTEAHETFTGNATAVSFTLAQSAKYVMSVTIGGSPGEYNATPATAEDWKVVGTTFTIGATGQELPTGMIAEISYLY